MKNYNAILTRFFERFYPSIGCCGILCFLQTYPYILTEVTINSISNAFFTVFSICCGFISTSLSILFSLQERRSIKTLKTSGAFSEIISFHWKAAGWGLLAIIVAFISTFNPTYELLKTPIVSIMLAIGGGALLAIFRLIHILVRVLNLEASQT